MPKNYPWPTKPHPWFSPLKKGVIDRIVKLTNAVDEGVEVGFHLCYGDARHKHFIEPKDTALLVEVANLICGGVGRDVDWVHMPVPKGRVDGEYYAPLKGLRLHEKTELFLGLVHGGDLEGTQKRIEVARNVVDGFGVATEYGMGRMPKGEFEIAIEVLAALTKRS
jgi:hypothetical protein